MRVLREVAARGTIAAAARALAFTPSAVSQQLAALERETGVALLDRHGGRVHLTEAGRRLVGRTEAILAELEAATAELEAAAVEVAGDVHVAAFPSAERALLAPAIATLAARHAEVRVRTTELEPEDALPALRLGDVDLAISHEDVARPRPRDDRLERADLLDDPLWLALPRGGLAGVPDPPAVTRRARRPRRGALGRHAARHRLPGDGRRRLPGGRLRPRHARTTPTTSRCWPRSSPPASASRWSPASRCPRSAGRRSGSTPWRTSR